MLTNTERQQIVEEVNAGTYGIDEALDDIAEAQKGEEVRKALYAEALVLNREGHAGSTDMIARQQIANLQTSVNGQISTFRTEVGEDIDDLEAALNSGLATQNGRIAAQNATIANVVKNYNLEYGSETLWEATGETGALAAGTTVTLSEDVSHFDYIDIYSFCGNSNVLDTVPVDAKLQSNAGYALRWVNLSDPGSGSYKAYVRIIETRLHIIGTTLTIDHQVTYRNGEEVSVSGAEITQSNRSTYMGELGIMKIVGRKITANTEIEDVRIGADGTEYDSAGQAVRAQVTALESAIPAVDSTLSTQGAAADAKVAGDKAAELKSAITEITENTDNLFNPYSIVIGMNASGATGFPKRAISGLMNVGDGGACIKAYNLPANLKYDVEWYSTADRSSRVFSSAWITDATTYYYTSQYSYIAILFARTDDADLTPSDFDGLQMMVNAGADIYPYQPFVTANDLSARKKSEFAKRLAAPINLFPVNGWSYGSIRDGSEVASTSRIRSDYINVKANQTVVYVTADQSDETEYRVNLNFYDSEKTWISETNYAAHVFSVPSNATYIRIVLGHFLVGTSTSQPINPVTSPAESGTNLFYGDYGKNTNTLKVMTFNMGRYSYGVSPYGIATDIYDEKIINWRNFFGEQNADIIGGQEWDRIINYDNDTQANDALFNHWYPYSVDTGNWGTIKSKRLLVNGGIGQLTTSGRYYVWAWTTIYGKLVYLLNVHLKPGYDAESAEIRAQEAAEIVNMLSGKEYYIVFGDFNPNAGEEDALFKIFTDAGSNIANCGFFGKIWTWTNDPANYERETPTGNIVYVDNILTSGNITILNVKKVNTYKSLTSDHIPIVAEIAVN